MAKALDRIEIQDEAFVRRAINANLRLGDKASAQRLATFANNSRASLEMRADALWALGYWGKPPVLDRVDGRYRENPAGKIADAHEAVNPYLKGLLYTKQTPIQIAAVQLLGRLQMVDYESALRSILDNYHYSVEARQAALISIGQLPNADIESATQDSSTR